ncbi:MAG: hypothetical protein WBP45_11060 [Daejeonella sp.]
MDAIATWLKSPSDYFKGLDLLKSHTGNGFLISVLSSGPDSYNTPTLYEELQKIAKAAEAVIITRETNKPADLQHKEESANQMMDRRAELKAQLRFLMNDPKALVKRKDIAFEILRLTSQLDVIFDEKEFYAEHGYVPSGTMEVADDPLKLKARQVTLRTYITRYNKPGSSEVKLKEYQEELAIVNKKLEKHAL